MSQRADDAETLKFPNGGRSRSASMGMKIGRRCELTGRDGSTPVVRTVSVREQSTFIRGTFVSSRGCGLLDLQEAERAINRQYGLRHRWGQLDCFVDEKSARSFIDSEDGGESEPSLILIGAGERYVTQAKRALTDLLEGRASLGRILISPWGTAYEWLVQGTSYRSFRPSGRGSRELQVAQFEGFTLRPEVTPVGSNIRYIPTVFFGTTVRPSNVMRSSFLQALARLLPGGEVSVLFRQHSLFKSDDQFNPANFGCLQRLLSVNEYLKLGGLRCRFSQSLRTAEACVLLARGQ